MSEWRGVQEEIVDYTKIKQTSWPLVSKWTIPTERTLVEYTHFFNPTVNIFCEGKAYQTLPPIKHYYGDKRKQNKGWFNMQQAETEWKIYKHCSKK
jgi:hypothetical protein